MLGNSAGSGRIGRDTNESMPFRGLGSRTKNFAISPRDADTLTG
jgi:hypothetical protein